MPEWIQWVDVVLILIAASDMLLTVWNRLTLTEIDEEVEEIANGDGP